MRWTTAAWTVCALILGTAPAAWAQDVGTRPATTTLWGDTGLWFVPTAEVATSGDLSLSLQRIDADFRQGNTNVSYWPLTGAFGMKRFELFGALRVVTRIDRDTQPLLFAGPGDENGGLVNEHPSVNQTWTGNELGDLFLGGKVNMSSQARRDGLAWAVRGTVKLPTADSDRGIGTGEYDWFADLIASRDFGRMELTGFGGFALRGDPGAISVSDSVRWGVGVSLPSRSRLRVTAEAHGEWMVDDSVTAPAGLVVGEDGSLSPAASSLKDPFDTAVGITWQARNGLLLGAAMNYRFGLGPDGDSGLPRRESADSLGVSFRIGFHRGVGAYVPPPPAVSLATPPPAPTPVPAPPPPPATRGSAAPDTTPIAAPARPLDSFDHVLFDFDSAVLRREALPSLDPVIAALRAQPLAQLIIEGHTCSVGTVEYNLALGERRATAVRDYLVSRGIDAVRLLTVSMGEEDPAHDNATEANRRLNRRAEMVIRATDAVGTSGR